MKQTQQRNKTNESDRKNEKRRETKTMGRRGTQENKQHACINESGTINEKGQNK